MTLQTLKTMPVVMPRMAHRLYAHVPVNDAPVNSERPIVTTHFGSNSTRSALSMSLASTTDEPVV
jgi:hypothetical protein